MFSSAVSLRQVRDNFFIAELEDTKVLVEYGGCYVNATRMCDDVKRALHNWRQTKLSKTLTEAMSTDTPPFKTVTEDGVSGIYIHRLLAPHLACWISAKHAVNVGTILNNLMVREWSDQVHFMNVTQEQTTQYYESLIDDWRRVVSEKDEVIEVKEKELVEVRKQQRPDWSSTNTFALVRTNSENCLPYYGIAGQRRQFNASLKRLRRKHPHAEVVFQQKAVSKDIHIVTQLRKDKVIKTKHNYFVPISMS